MQMVTEHHKSSILLYLAPQTYRSRARDGAVFAKQRSEDSFLFNQENFFLQDRTVTGHSQPLS